MSSPTAAPLEASVVAALAERAPDAIAAAYEALADPLFRYVRSRCRDDELAADVVEATFVELLEAAPQLEGGDTGLRRWMFTAARHNLLDEQRKQRRRGDVPLSDETGADDGAGSSGAFGAGKHGGVGQAGHAEAAANPEERLIAAEGDAEVRAALATLPDDQREVLELRFAGELTAKETGEVMGRSPGAVRVLQHRAIRALGSILDAEGAETARDQVAGAAGDSAEHATAKAPRGPPSRAP